MSMTYRDLVAWFATAPREEVDRVREIVALIDEARRHYRPPAPPPSAPAAAPPATAAPTPAPPQKPRRSRDQPAIYELCEDIIRERGPMSAAELTKVLHQEHDRKTTTVNSVRAILHRRVLRGITFMRLSDYRFALLADPRERSDSRHERAEDDPPIDTNKV